MKGAKNMEERINNLLSKMTLEEKIGQLNQISAKKEEVENIIMKIEEGKVGSVILAATAHAGKEDQATVSLEELIRIQQAAVESSRLGIPILIARDILHGYNTIFPTPLAQAASWNTELVKTAAAIAADEASANSIHWAFVPMMDIARDPRWGRVIEGYGEDPYLTSEMARAVINGFQGDDLSVSGNLAATAKHYVAYGAGEGGRDYNSVDISEYTLRNVYLPPFKAAVEAGVCTVMSSFNDIAGEPVTSNQYLITDVLKDEFGFNGIVISDWDSVVQLIIQGTVSNRKDAALKAFNAGIDVNMNDECYINNISDLIREDKIKMSRLDDAVRRVLRVKFRLGLHKNPYKGIGVPRKSDETKRKYTSYAKQLACESMVLLKNEDNILPISKSQKIAVIGPMTNEKRSHMGSWALDGNEKEVVSIMEGIKSVVPEAEILESSSGLFDDMLETARKADIVIVALGESWARTGEGQNVSDIKLSIDQEKLIEALHIFNKNIIAVICAGRPLSLVKIEQYAKAIIYAWHSGVQAGAALADILFGKFNPCGKLPITFPRSSGQIPIYYNHRNTGRLIDEYYNCSEYFNYHDQLGKPLYQFGYGLSYTNFKYDGICLNTNEIKLGAEVIVSINVTNIGDREGVEIAQCYLNARVGRYIRPVRELKGFKRIHLEPSETKVVSFKIGIKELLYYGPDGKPILDTGDYTLLIGSDCLATNNVSFKVTE